MVSGVDGKEVAGRVGVQAVVQKGGRALRKGEIKRNLKIKRREEESKLGTVGAPGTPLWGQCCLETPQPSSSLRRIWCQSL